MNNKDKEEVIEQLVTEWLESSNPSIEENKIYELLSTPSRKVVEKKKDITYNWIERRMNYFYDRYDALDVLSWELGILWVGIPLLGFLVVGILKEVRN